MAPCVSTTALPFTWCLAGTACTIRNLSLGLRSHSGMQRNVFYSVAQSSAGGTEIARTLMLLTL